jgi:hypothetical protein
LVPLPIFEVIAGLVALLLLAIPLGSVLLQIAERAIGRKILLTPTERILLSFYASGGLLFVLASLPLPLFNFDSVIGLLVGGIVARAALSIRGRGRDFSALFRFARSPAALGVLALFAGLLVLEVISVSALTLGNSVDGSVYSLFIQLILKNHTVPWTLQPYATTGVVYPQGAPVWMTVPNLAFGWPIVALPVDIPPLFLALSVPAAFCLGERWGGYPQPRSARVGLLFAAFFGLVVSWPRLFVGGSFDFLFSLPLFMLTLGWLMPLATGPRRSWAEVGVLGGFVGITTSLSASTGFTILLLLVVFLLSASTDLIASLRKWWTALLAIAGIAALFLLRSIVGLVIWFNYPGHVQSAVGNPPYASYGFPQPLTRSIVLGELDPFVLWKPKFSPFAPLSLTIEVLFGVGLALLVLNWATRSRRLRALLSLSITRTILVASLTIFVETAIILVASGLNPSASGLQTVTNLDELSILLFTSFELAALVPLLMALNFLTRSSSTLPTPEEDLAELSSSQVSVRPSVRKRWAATSRKDPVAAAMAMLILIVPLSLGLGYSVVAVPAYIHDHITGLANVTAGDLTVLQWAGDHLPPCSRVLVAPGSVAQYLPEYAQVQMVFPVFPPTVNQSYYSAVGNLIQGIYQNSTRGDLLSIGITSVFVTGRSSASYPPFQLSPLLTSPDFSLLIQQQDAAIFAFAPGVLASGCQQ